MEKSLPEVLKENKQKIAKRRLEELKKQKRKEQIKGNCIAILLILACALFIWIYNASEDEAMEKCIAAGNSKELCEVKL